jgi:hypothetical protein
MLIIYRYTKDGKHISTSDWKFGHGRVSNASIETYFRTVKLSVLENKTSLRPNEFLMPYYNHMCSRFKGDELGVAQSSHNRKKAQNKSDDLNVKETWRRRAPLNTNNKKGGRHFTDKVSQTNACKLS